MRPILNFLLTGFVLWMLFTTVACKKESVNTDPALKLEFSTDTVLFDTVFTTVGSITQQLKIYNRNNAKVKISEIRLGKGTGSAYKINIDGYSSTQVTDVELDAGDSLYVFVKVIIDPTNQNSPLVVTDSLICTTNGNVQDVKLVAWGQDAYYHTPDHFPTDFPAYSIINCNDVWTNDKPHLIYGMAVVDSACTLTIQEGAKVYFHNNGILMVYKDGSLKVNGSAENKVLFRNDRLDELYKDLPGQWNGIWLSEGSLNNEINHALIQNGTLGIQVDITGESANPGLVLNNTRIENMKLGGLSCNATSVSSVNCAFVNCGEYAVALNGGLYDFRHATIGNFWSSSTRQTPSLVLKNYYVNPPNEVVNVTPSEVYFGNSIIYGNLEDELLIGIQPEGTSFLYTFDHCLVRTLMNTSDFNIFKNCLVNEDPLFVDVGKMNVEPDSLSPARSFGIPLEVETDYYGRPRDVTPDLGAFETQFEGRK